MPANAALCTSRSRPWTPTGFARAAVGARAAGACWAGAVVPIQGYRCSDSTKAARNHPPCATATATTQPVAASQSSITDWSAGLGADGCRNGACADSVISTSLTCPLHRKRRDETFRLQSKTSHMSRQDEKYRLLSFPVSRPSRCRESSRRATLDAALALLRADGYGAMTIERIAAKAGVGKQTIYRWWPSKGAVVFEALLEDLRVSLTFDDTGDLRADPTTQVTSLSRVFASPDGRHMAALIGGAQGDPDLAQALLEHWVRPRRRYAMAFLQQAKDRGQLRPDLDLEVGIDIIWAPLYYRLLLHYAPLDEAHAAAVVDAALTVWLSAPTDRPRRSDAGLAQAARTTAHAVRTKCGQRSTHADAASAGAPGQRHAGRDLTAVSYTHLRAHETVLDLVCRL